MALSVLVMLPLAGAAAVTRLRHRGRFEPARRLALGVAVGTWAVTLAAWFWWDPATGGVQLVERRPWIEPFGASFHIGVDGIGLVVVTLIAWMSALALFVSWRMGGRAPAGLVAALLVVESAAMLTVVARDLLLFFVGAEALLFATFAVVGAWGRDRRVLVSTRFLLLQLVASSLMLTVIIWLAWRHQIATGAWSYAFDDLAALDLPVGVHGWIWAALAVVFAARLPVVPLHTWLADALVQAPVPGAVIIGGVAVPVGGYALLRVVVPLLPPVPPTFAFWIAAVATAGVIYGAVAALGQTDLRRFGATLIVSHLGVVLMAGSASTPAASAGALVHLLVVALWSGAWLLVVGMLGQRRHTTQVSEFGGLLRVVPGLGGVFVLTGLTAIAVPGTAAYVGIARVFDGITSESSLIDGRLFGALAAFGMAIWSVCLARVVLRVAAGAVTRDRNRGLRDLNGGEWLVVAPLVLVAIVLGLWPDPLLSLVQNARPESWLGAFVVSSGGGP